MEVIAQHDQMGHSDFLQKEKMMRILKAVFIEIQSENIFSIAFTPKIGGKTSEIMFYLGFTILKKH